MSPEMVRVASEFLRSLADRTDTIIIAGNHDCFTEDHELLTEHGWIKIKDIVENKIDKVMAYSSTGTLQFETPYAYINKLYHGDMIHLTSKNVDMLVTTTHEIPYYHYNSNKKYRKIALDVPKTAKLMSNGNYNCTLIESKWSELLGFICGDGSLVTKPSKIQSGAGRIQFRLKRVDTIEYCVSLLNELNIKFSSRVDKDGVTVICVYGEFAKKVILTLDGERKNPNFIYSKSIDEQYSFIVGYLKADGHLYKKNPNFYTVATVRDDYKELLLTLPRLFGGTSHLHNARPRGNYPNSKLQYILSVNLNRSERFFGIKDKTTIVHAGRVYCVSVPSANLLVRRNNKIYISGNCNLANPHRLDALSPIVDNLSHKSLHYLKDSGIYKFANIEFGVNSIIGDSSDWPLISEFSPSVRKIGLYHAPVDKAKTDVGYTISNRVSVDTFNGYDMVLLGDIHKSQILQERDEVNNKPEICYVGSLIQQNHGESLNHHGYAVWNILTAKVEEFIEVPNDYGYCTITLDSAKLPNTSHLPKNTRLRLFVGNVDQTLVKKVIASIRKKHNIVEMSVNRLIDKTAKSNGTGHKSIIDNIHDVSHQNSLLKEYIEKSYPNCDTDMIQKVLDINTKLNNQIGDDDLPKNIHWQPLYLKFDNLFSYGEGNEINFETMNGIMGVFSPNATGKTSAFDAMCFALYDKTPRAFKGSHIMNTRKSKFFCELRFEVENTSYVIQRTGNRKKGGDVKVDVNFYRIEPDGSEISLNGEDRRDTNSNIRSYVGTYEDFILTTLSVQNQNSLFIDTGQTDRKDLLSQFIGLTIFDRLYNTAADEVKEVMGALKSFKKDDFTQKLVDIQTQIEEISKSNVMLRNNEISIKSELDNIDVDLQSNYKLKLPVRSFDSIEKLTNKLEIETILLNTTNKEFESTTETRNTVDTWKQEASNKATQITQGSTSHPLWRKGIDEVKFTLKLRAESEIVLSKLKSELKFVGFEIIKCENIIKQLKNHKYDPNCQFCIDSVFVKNAETAQLELISLNKTFENLHQKIDDGEQYLVSTSELQSQLDTFLQFRKLSDEHEMERAKLDGMLNVLYGKQILYKINVTKYANEISEYKLNETAIITNLEIDKKIADFNQVKSNTNKELSKIQNKISVVTGELAVAKNTKDQMLSRIKEAEDLEDIFEAYEIYLQVIGRDGLPYYLMSTVIPDLQTQINNLLSQMVEFTVSLDVDGKNINGRIVYDDDRSWPLELASGMEKFISGLAIRVALMSVSNLPKANFMVADEGFGVLDADNLNSIYRLFDMLKNQFEFVILISHLDIMRDMVDTTIEITRDNGYSYLKVT
jgi:DNA repair exonuclease SbcCD ATPase subunit